MHIPAEPAERSRPAMSTDRITAAALQIVDTEKDPRRLHHGGHLLVLPRPDRQPASGALPRTRR